MVPVHIRDLTAIGGSHYVLHVGPVGVRLTRCQLAALRRCLHGVLADTRAGVPFPAATACSDGVCHLAFEGALTIWFPDPAEASAEVVFDYASEPGLLARIVVAVDAALYGPVPAE